MLFKTSGRRFLSTLYVLTVLFSGSVAAENSGRRLVVFGDSLTDPGNAFVLTHQVSVPPFLLIPSFPYARDGHHFSNGETWVEQLAQHRQFDGACPALRQRGICTDYAVGGARARREGLSDLSSQVTMFLGDFSGAAQEGALYVVHIGGNDVRDALEALKSDPTGATSAGILVDALNVIAENIVTLASAGAREFVVPNAPNFALVPAVRFQGAQAQAAAQFLSLIFNQQLELVVGGLEASLPVTIHRLDVFTLIGETVANPAAAGFKVVVLPCIKPGVVGHAVCRHPDDFLFWDGIHPTEAGHALIARKAKEILTR